MQEVPIDFPFCVKTLGGYLYIYQGDDGKIKGSFYEPDEIDGLCEEHIVRGTD